MTFVVADRGAGLPLLGVDWGVVWGALEESIDVVEGGVEECSVFT